MSLQNLESLKSLVALMDLIQNPEKYQGLIDAAQKATAEYYKAAGVLHSVEEVKQYKAKLDQEHVRRMSDVDKDVATLAKENTRLEQLQESLATEKQQVEKKLAEREKLLVLREEAVKGLEKLRGELLEARKDLETQKELVNKQHAELKRRENALKAALV